MSPSKICVVIVRFVSCNNNDFSFVVTYEVDSDSN